MLSAISNDIIRSYFRKSLRLCLKWKVLPRILMDLINGSITTLVSRSTPQWAGKKKEKTANRISLLLSACSSAPHSYETNSIWMSPGGLNAPGSNFANRGFKNAKEVNSYKNRSRGLYLSFSSRFPSLPIILAVPRRLWEWKIGQPLSDPSIKPGIPSETEYTACFHPSLSA